jgi:ribosomal protein S18 acetylase RimI-like enzyme
VRATDAIRRVPAGPAREAYWPLFLLADDAEQQVRAYAQQGDLYVLDDGDGAALGIVLVLPHADGGAAELRSVAVDAERHGQGVGRRLVAGVLRELAAQGVERVIVGTASSSLGALRFYLRLGLRPLRIERDVFTPAKGYPEGSEEDGIPLRDVVWLDRATAP